MFLRRFLCLWITISFVSTLIVPPQKLYAQTVLDLPAPGTMVSVSSNFEPALIKGLTVHKDNPFLFDFIVDPGQDSGVSLKNQADRMIKYFFAALTIPDKDIWVNLSPYEKDRMIPLSLGQTAMGRDLLAQDYMLKQLTASLIYPQKALGKTFWNEVYTKAKAMYGTTQIPVNTFNKVWIVPQRAGVYEHNQTAFIVNGHLKVMLEEDYLSTTKHNAASTVIPAKAGIQTLGSNIIRQIILPEIEKEVNEGKNFATLRQIFYAQVLAVWFKRNLKQALLNQVYANKGTVKGIDQNDAATNEAIYHQYLRAYKKGVFNFIKEDIDPVTQETLPRKYFSGGYGDSAQLVINPAQLSPTDMAQAAKDVDFAVLTARPKDVTALAKPDAAMKAAATDRQKIRLAAKQIAIQYGLSDKARRGVELYVKDKNAFATASRIFLEGNPEYSEKRDQVGKIFGKAKRAYDAMLLSDAAMRIDLAEKIRGLNLQPGDRVKVQYSEVNPLDPLSGIRHPSTATGEFVFVSFPAGRLIVEINGVKRNLYFGTITADSDRLDDVDRTDAAMISRRRLLKSGAVAGASLLFGLPFNRVRAEGQTDFDKRYGHLLKSLQKRNLKEYNAIMSSRAEWFPKLLQAKSLAQQRSFPAIVPIYKAAGNKTIGTLFWQQEIADTYWSGLLILAEEYNRNKQYEKVKDLLKQPHSPVPEDSYYIQKIRALDHAMNAADHLGGIDLSRQDAALHVEKDANGGVKVNVDPALIARIEREGMPEVVPVIINMRPADIRSLLGVGA